MAKRGGRSSVAAALDRIELPGESRPLNLRDALLDQGVPAISLAVVSECAVAESFACGVKVAGSRRPVTPRTLFQAASLVKPFSALLALRLVQAGRIKLDGSIGDQLTSWKIPASHHAAVGRPTVRETLSMWGGFNVRGFAGYERRSPLPGLTQILDGSRPANSAPVMLQSRPGTRWSYSGGGYQVLQLLIEEATRRSYQDLMRDTILEPLRLRRTFIQPRLTARFAADAASGHELGSKPIKGGWKIFPELAAAGAWTTPTDVARLIVDLMRAYQGRPAKLVSQELAREMLSQQGGARSVYGLGLGVQRRGRHRYFVKKGYHAGYNSWLVGFPDYGHALVVMTNADSDVGDVLAQSVIAALLRAAGWPQVVPFSDY